MADPFLAEIRIVPINFAPKGWAFCNGQLMPISQNTALFSLLGTTYGGDGQSNFALPNLQGRTPMHRGQGPGLSDHNLGESDGEETVTLTQATMPFHSHTLLAAEEGTTTTPDGNHLAGTAAAPAFQSNTGANLVTMASTSQSTGGGFSHNNMQPYLTLNFIIALQGVFPPR